MFELPPRARLSVSTDSSNMDAAAQMQQNRKNMDIYIHTTSCCPSITATGFSVQAQIPAVKVFQQVPTPSFVLGG